MEPLVSLLHEQDCSCVIQNRQTRTFSRRGVIDIYDLLYEERSFLEGAAVADRVVGKAAAALMILGGVKKVHADVISCPAKCLLAEYGVEVEYDTVVGFIWNRTQTDMCPLDKLCSQENDLMAILSIVDNFISGMSS